MRVLQILHDRERGGVQTLSRIIERGLSPQGFAFETAYLYPQSDLSIIAKLVCVLRMTRRIWRGDSDIFIAYQSTASILVGTIGYIRGCRLRVVHQTCTPDEVPWPVRWLDKLVGTIGLYS